MAIKVGKSKISKVKAIHTEVTTMEKYTLTLIKAIANCEIEENIVQDAILVHLNSDEFSDGDSIIFGVTYDERWTDEDIDNILKCYDSMIGKSKILLTTEKDYMRLVNSEHIHKFDDVPLFIIPIEVRFNDKQEEESFKKILLNYVGKNS